MIVLEYINKSIIFMYFVRIFQIYPGDILYFSKKERECFMKTFKMFVSFALVIIMVSVMLPFSAFAEEQQFLVRDSSVNSNMPPIYSEHLFAIENTVYDSEGRVFVQFPSDQICVGITDDCAITISNSELLYVYCITGGKAIKTYSILIQEDSLIFPFEFELYSESEITHNLVLDHAVVPSYDYGISVIDSKGNVEISIDCDYGFYIGEGLIKTHTADNIDIVKLNGEVISSGYYDNVGMFTDGLAMVSKDGCYGYINPNGELVIEMKYTEANAFSYGYAEVARDNMSIVIDTEGNEIIKKTNGEKMVAHNAGIFVSNEGTDYIPCDNTGGGKTLGNKNYELLSDHYAYFYNDLNSLGFIHKDGGDLLLDGILFPSVDEDAGRIVALKDNAFREFDLDGNEISVLPDTYQLYYATGGNYFVGLESGTFGLISPDGRELIPLGSHLIFDTKMFDNGNQICVFINFDGESFSFTTYFMKLSDIPFNDVRSISWFYDSVKYAYDNGLFNGITSSDFAPDNTMTRAMIVTVLWRMCGSPAPESSNNPFKDVLPNSWYADAVLWAAENNIVSGITPDSFAPDSGATREQIATLIYRYADYKNYDMSGSGDLTQFNDSNRIGGFAELPMSWVVSKNLISGRGNGILDPQGRATRAEVATILMRLIEGFENVG